MLELVRVWEIFRVCGEIKERSVGFSLVYGDFVLKNEFWFQATERSE